MDHAQRGAQRPKSPSIGDVARLAGVSAQTVSRVSTGAQNVRPATRMRVQEAMSKLGYVPNRAARALRSGAFGALGIITQRLERTGDALTTAAVVSSAQERGYATTLLEVRNPDSGELRDASVRLSHLAVDGLIIIRAGHATHRSLTLPPALPVAVSDSRLVGHYSSVVANQIGGTQEAVRHLLGLGHRTVHHIAGAADSQPAVVRSATWRRCLNEHGIVPPEPLQGDWTARSGYQAGQRLAADPDVTAVYCANDEMAFGLMRALHEAGRRVPDDVSVIGFDGIALSEFSSPPLTTIRQDFTRIGTELVRLVAEQLDGTATGTPSRVVVPTELLVRGTTAPPAR